jgi:hypothetical protein
MNDAIGGGMVKGLQWMGGDEILCASAVARANLIVWSKVLVRTGSVRDLTPGGRYRDFMQFRPTVAQQQHPIQSIATIRYTSSRKKPHTWTFLHTHTHTHTKST